MLFAKCSLSTNVTSIDEIDSELAEMGEDDEDFDTSEERFTFVEPDTYVSLLSAPNSFELFIVCEFKEKLIANEDLCDFYGHIIKKGEKKRFYSVIQYSAVQCHTL